MSAKLSLNLLCSFHPLCSSPVALALRLWVQGDNAPKECRNVAMAKWAITMVQSGFFKQVSECFLEVGHTHEDVGGVCYHGNVGFKIPYHDGDTLFLQV